MSSFRMWKGLKKARLPWKNNIKSFEAVRRLTCVRCDGANDKLLKDKNEMMKLFPLNDKKGFHSLISPNMKHHFPSPLASYHSASGVVDASMSKGIQNCIRIVKGMRLEEDVVSLLSNGGKRDYLVRNNGVKVAVESITGKYLIICCFKLPLPPLTWAGSPLHARDVCRAMIAAYSHLLEKNINNFEMVMVAKMASAVDGHKEEAAFNKFFDAFPCLAIPFWDTESRDFVCKSLGLTDPEKHHASLVLDPDQMVLQTNAKCIYDYGATGFPYTTDRLAALRCEHSEIKKRLNDFDELGSSPLPVSLVELLGSDVLLSRFSDGRKISASDLSKKKCVGLYLCMEGDFMGMLNGMEQGCLNENLEFEIVVVPMFVLGATASYVEDGQLSFEGTTWWMMPSDDGWEAARRLRKIYHPVIDDDLIILADGGNDVQLGARRLIDRITSYDPFAKHYPFTRKSWSDKFFSHLRSFTLESLLGVEGYLLSSDSSTRVPVSELKGRNVLLYLDYYDEIFKGGDLYKMVLHSYTKIQEDYPNSEVVFVPLDKEVPHTRCPALPWLSLPHPAAAIQRSVISGLFPEGSADPNLFAFGDDGLIHSLAAYGYLENGADGDSLFDDNLLEQIFYNLEYEFLWI